ncbi:MAG TPA: PilT/PilU family type 4a pilus ATPase [Methylococcaceae bacterium]|nr:PilT/PilU family type 4a pilus ATPase [Methylococcaceae bacterium]HIA45218.1 PilT/PilU family type 4a pilus ATPase [Methylococcaceae bacterium]HIB63025.1 PilT/PilU family type 4a pilus ATPase [Methylococcaceae bacterium]HIN68318.1 PilT/PilU family type 4a pilus ATPase [Methylococcales bacterium]HIO45166.1 PilT/PilU family type 4a pilus ATPase [Methylococcales bacterium]
MSQDFKNFLEIMVAKKASDFFVTVGRPPSIKVENELVDLSADNFEPEMTMAWANSLMDENQRLDFERTGECNFAFSVAGLARFRVSAFMQKGQAGMVIRRIESKIPDLSDLSLPAYLSQLIMENRGLILVVGGTGSGKSTTLAAMIKLRNQNASGHIITIEDPIEFVHGHIKSIVTQREVGIDTQSFEVALKNTLRQAPDVILIGEIRTRETMQHALAFAETGHLCLATLHANNANQALDRVLGFFPEELHGQVLKELSLNLKGIIAQQLVKRKEGKGMCPAVEVLLNTPLMSDLIAKGAIDEIKELIKRSQEQGMQTFDQALFQLYDDNKISYENALALADSTNEVRLMIKLGSKNDNESTKDEVKRMKLTESEDEFISINS